MNTRSIQNTKNAASPLSRTQKEVLVRTVNSMDEERICYRDIMTIFHWLGVSLFTREEKFSLIFKGGNIFLNHLIFSLMYMREWTTETKDIFHVSELALRLNSALSPQLYRYVWLRARSKSGEVDIEVLERGKGWFVNPFDARDNGMFVKNILSNPFLSDFFKPVLMLESSCACLIFLDESQRQVSRGIKCNCLQALDSTSIACEQGEGYDEVDIPCRSISNISLNECDKGNESKHDSTIINGVKVSRCSVENATCIDEFQYVIEHNNVKFTSKISDITSAYAEYVSS